ncbi:histidinol dehydrogenase [Alkalibacillus flavidus]|uniref:Histidinol dehydrogenase n=1 Tax=Alkalibacillus flavidus TaxID=546021 RepID=A0ABV2KXT3_9BACI
MKINVIEEQDIAEIVTNRKNRDAVQYDVIDERVKSIVQTIRRDGDEAVRGYIKSLDGVDLNNVVVSAQEIEEAYTRVSDDMMAVLTEAKENIQTYHAKQKETSWYSHNADGVWLGQQVTPIVRIGVYVPGGKAAYPSTVLMNIMPAVVAGVSDITVTTPVQPDGTVNPMTLVGADLAGASRILKIGGAHGIATLAYGTESITPVDKIVGPGNAYVARAKKYVFGDVGIDMIAGPSEVCVVADETANPAYVAADLLAQAEHDELASAVAVTTSEAIASAIQTEVERQMKTRDRQAILQESVTNQGAIYVTTDLEMAMTFVNAWAPEHLELQISHPFEWLPSVKHAGAIFLGHYTPEPLGDYFAGPNHTLPTNGTAKFSSPLGVYDFMKKSSVIYYTDDALEQVRQQVEQFAGEEGLDGHRDAVRIRFDEK